MGAVRRQTGRCAKQLAGVLRRRWVSFVAVPCVAQRRKESSSSVRGSSVYFLRLRRRLIASISGIFPTVKSSGQTSEISLAPLGWGF